MELPHLKHMERLELDVLLLTLQQVHHELQVLSVADVLRHDCEVMPIEQQLAEQLHVENGTMCSLKYSSV